MKSKFDVIALTLFRTGYNNRRILHVIGGAKMSPNLNPNSEIIDALNWTF